MLGTLLDHPRALRLWLAALLLWLAVAAIAALALWHLRQNDLNSQLRETALLSMALSDELDHGLRGVEQGLNAMREELRDRVPQRGAEAEQRLSRRVRLMPLAQTLWLIDGNGQLLSASDKTAPPALSTFYPPLDSLAENATAVSRPFTQIDAKESRVALAARISGIDEIAGGWILAGFSANALSGAFSVASPGGDARMAVFRDDGVRLIGTIVDNPTLDEASIARLLATRPSMDVHKFSDGRERLVSLHGLPRYSLKIMLTRDLGVALKLWIATVEVAGAGIAMLLAILAIAVRQVVRADLRRAAAQRALQTQLARASKLQSLGTLAGGVAHDFNNVLAAILGFAEMAQDAALRDSNQARHLDKVLQAALRGKSLVERILAFSRGGAHIMIVFEFAPIVDEVFSLLAASLRPGLLLERQIEAPAARIRGDPTQAFEAVMNLCTNAMQAMSEGGGILRVELRRSQVSVARVLSHSQLATGHYVVLTVSDQGIGINPEVMERLFQPFFTTRSQNSGIGLGLAVVHGVVTEFGGAIDVQSVPGHGSRFILYFPECSDAIGPPQPLPKMAAIGAGRRLMIVDDEPGLVVLAEETLRQLGYDPVGHTDPVAALAAVQENPAHFAAVITDEVMPGLSGTQFTRALRICAPDLPVLLISGYGGALLASRAAAAGVTRVLSKPLRRTELARALSELLP